MTDTAHGHANSSAPLAQTPRTEPHAVDTPDQVAKALAAVRQAQAAFERVTGSVDRSLREAEHALVERERARAEPGTSPPSSGKSWRRRLYSWLFTTTLPVESIRRTLAKLSQRGGTVSKRVHNRITMYMGEGAVIFAAFVSGALAIKSLVQWIDPRQTTESGPETATLAIVFTLFAVTLGAIASEFRFFRALREESEAVLRLNEMDERYAQQARDGIGYYSSIIRNLRHGGSGWLRGNGSRYYRAIAERELNAHRDTLKRLADGTHRAPAALMDEMLDAVLDSDSTYAAVTHRDTDYWLKKEDDPDAIKYRDQLDTAARKGKVMRIFIVKLEDLRDRWEDYLEIIEDQEGTDVSWGIAVEERLDRAIPLLWEADVAPDLRDVRANTFDFALVKNGEVATFFIHDDDHVRHLLAAFHIPPRQRAVRACGSMFVRLISECWIGSATFGTHWPDFLSNAIDDRLGSELGVHRSTQDFVEDMGKQWKTGRIRRLKLKRELIRRMGIDPDAVIRHTERSLTGPLAITRSPDERSLREDMELFRTVLKADVFATSRSEHVKLLCGTEEAIRYEKLSRELNISPTT